MGKVFICLFAAPVFLWVIGMLAVIIAFLIWKGTEYPQYGIAGAVFLWMATAWTLHSRKVFDK